MLSMIFHSKFHITKLNYINNMRILDALRRSTEISLVIRQTMEACIMTHLMPRSQVPLLHLWELFLHECVVCSFLSLVSVFFRLIFLCKFSKQMEVNCDVSLQS